MNDIITVEFSSSDITSASTEQLKHELGRAMSLTSRVLVYLSQIWRELERRGEDLSNLRTGLSKYLPLIADDQLCPDAVIAFAGQKMLLQYVSTLPIGQQRALAIGEMEVEVLTKTDGGEEIVSYPAAELSGPLIRQAFENGRIRSIDEQSRWLSASTHSRSSRQRRRNNRGTDDDQSAREKASVPEDAKPRAPILLTDREHSLFRTAARDHGMSQKEFLRYAVYLTGAFS